MIRLDYRRHVVWLALAVALLMSAGCVKPGEAAVSELPAGTVIEVKLLDSLDTSTSRAGDEFTGVMAEPVALNGRVVLPAGAQVRGFVQKSVSSARSSARSMLAIGLRSVQLEQRRLELETHSIARVSGDHKKRSMIPVALTESEDVEVRIPAQSVLAFRLRERLAL